jgi:hypothetical protein
MHGDRGDEEHEVGAVLQQAERVEPEDVPNCCLLTAAGGWGGGEQEAEDSEDERCHGGHPEGPSQLSLLFPAQPADDHAGDDPADGAEHPDCGELPLRAGHLSEGHGVDQRQGRHVNDHVGENDREERPEGGHRRGEEQQPGTGEVQDAQHLLRVDQATSSGRRVRWATRRPVSMRSSVPPQTGSSCSTDRTPW